MIQFKRVQPGNQAILPEYKTALASGFDLHACLEEEVILLPMQRTLIPTGWIIAVGDDEELQIRPRSGLAFKNGISVVNTPGTIDADYRGEVKVLLINMSDVPFTIRHGDRIAQGVVQKVVRRSLVEVEDVNETERGAGGFGHTGV